MLTACFISLCLIQQRTLHLPPPRALGISLMGSAAPAETAGQQVGAQVESHAHVAAAHDSIGAHDFVVPHLHWTSRIRRSCLLMMMWCRRKRKKTDN